MTGTRTFRSVAETIVPEIRQLDDAAWQDVTRIIEHALAQRPAKVRRQLGAFVFALNALSFTKYGRTLNQLIPTMRTEFLEEIQNSRYLLVRRGFWGLRTLVFLGYYARPETQALIGYRANTHGWAAIELENSKT